uniref:Disease resistance protein At4g27190-like leucine-rich repeats domain-containing protein n=1 Tax=Arundo donax TaxID=35708 RepID=A0A0A9F7V4_ARUDO
MESSVFTTPPIDYYNNIFSCLVTFWASQFLNARYIWVWSASSFRPGYSSFKDLVFLHLDNCPRLIHVLPLYTSNVDGCCRLVTLEIMCCGDLREVFPRNSDSEQQEPREFPRLKHIHLYELPKLQRICGRRMFAPNLETVKIRGCWSLRHLPAVRPRSSSTPPPEVDCEKEWWACLQWDWEEASHHPSLYKPSHSKYYKKTQLRGSVLR